MHPLVQSGSAHFELVLRFKSGFIFLQEVVVVFRDLVFLFVFLEDQFDRAGALLAVGSDIALEVEFALEDHCQRERLVFAECEVLLRVCMLEHRLAVPQLLARTALLVAAALH